MNDLSDDAKALFEAARPRHEPTAQDREKVRAALVVRIGSAAATLGVAQTGGAASLVPGAAAATGAKTLLALKLVVALTAAGGAGTLAYRWVAPSAPPSGTSVRAHRPSGGATSNALPQPPAVAPQGQDAQRQPGEIDLAPTPPAKPPVLEAKPSHERLPGGREPTAPPIAAFPEERRSLDSGPKPGAGKFPDDTPRSSDLSLEARALSRVQRAVREGRSSEALRLLDEQERDFPQGELRQERVAARVVALCAAGKASEARALAASFLAQAPRSPLAARMRTICADE